EGLGRLRIARGEGDGDRAAHAPAEHESSLDAEVLEEFHALLGEESPGESLYAATGRTRLTAVVGNHRDGGGERGEALHLLPHARRSPLLHGCVEAAGGEHEERGALTARFVGDLESVEHRSRHSSSSSSRVFSPLTISALAFPLETSVSARTAALWARVSRLSSPLRGEGRGRGS